MRDNMETYPHKVASVLQNLKIDSRVWLTREIVQNAHNRALSIYIIASNFR